MKKSLWVLMTLLAVLMALGAWRFMLVPALITDEGWGNHLAGFPAATYLHFSLGPLALIVGAFQFVPQIRQRWPRVHRAFGKIYVLSCVLAGAAGFLLAVNTEAGPLAASGFGTLAALWISMSLGALAFARVGRFDLHMRWMVRSYALTYGAVTLRLMMPISEGLLGLEGAYPYIAWLCWTTNLAAVEGYFYLLQKRSNVAAAGGSPA